MLNIGVLSSSTATDLQAVIDAIGKKKLDASIVAVVSDKKDAIALARAKKHGIAAFFVDPREFKETKEKEARRELFDRKVAGILENKKADIVLLIGYMRIISPWLVKKYKDRIMNIHPSLLPAFAGGMDMDVHAQVLASGVAKTGCTLHFVDEGVDSGPIIFQKEVLIAKNETKESLKEKVQKAEQEIIVKAIKLYSEGKIKVRDNTVVIKS